VFILIATTKLNKAQAGMFIKFIRESIRLGLILGVILSIVYWTIVFLLPSIFTLYGIVFGAILGILLGALNGVVLAILSFRFRFNSNNVRQYRYLMLFSSVFSTILVTTTIFYLTLLRYSVPENSNSFSLLILLAVGLASIGSAYGSQVLSTWYLKHKES